MKKRRAAIVVAMIALSATSALAKPELSKREFNDLKKDAQRAAVSGDYNTARAKLSELGRDDSERAIKEIVKVAAKIPEVYEAGVNAVAGMQSSEAIDYLLEEAEASRGRLEEKIFVVDVLAARRDDRSAEGLGLALDGWKRYPAVARAAVQAIEKRKAVKSVDGLIRLLGELEEDDPDSLLMTQVREALVAITGETFEKAVDYRNFWEPRKASFRPVTGKRRPEAGKTGERKRPTFFGSEIRSNRLVFVIDVSGSMQAADPARPQRSPTGGRRGPQTGGGDADEDEKPPVSDSRVRIDRAKFQLLHAIDALPEHAQFAIIAYSGGAAMPGSGNGDPDDPLPPTVGGFEWLKAWNGAPRLHRASDSNKAEAKGWVDQLQANGSTFTYNALLHAFEVEGADAIIILSDGAPTEINRETGAQMSTDEILEKVREKNRFRRLRIDTFGFGSDMGGGAAPGGLSMPRRGPGGGLAQFMQELARQNGGEYTPIE